MNRGVKVPEKTNAATRHKFATRRKRREQEVAPSGPWIMERDFGTGWAVRKTEGQDGNRRRVLSAAVFPREDEARVVRDALNRLWQAEQTDG